MTTVIQQTVPPASDSALESSLRHDRLAMLKEKQRSLRDNALNRTRSTSSVTSEENDDAAERLSRSMSRIRVKRPSETASLDFAGIIQIVNKESSDDRSESSSISKISMSSRTSMVSKKDNNKVVGLFADPGKKTVLANHPIDEDCNGSVTSNQSSSSKRVVGFFVEPGKKTVLANHPVRDDCDASVSSNQSSSSKRVVGFFVEPGKKTVLANHPVRDDCDASVSSNQSSSSKRVVGFFVEPGKKTVLSTYSIKEEETETTAECSSDGSEA